MSRVLSSLRERGAADAVALQSPRGDWTRADLAASIERIAKRLDARGPGAVGILLDNTPLWVAADLAVLAAGRVCVPIPSFFSASQIGFVGRVAGISLWLCADGRAPGWISSGDWRAEEIEPGLWLGGGERAARDALRPHAGTAKITFTSGTTGTPKGVCLSQEAMEAVAGSLAALSGELSLRSHLCALPLPLLLENLVGVHAALLAGIPSTLVPLGELGWSGSSALDPVRLLDQLECWRPQSLILVPELLEGLVTTLESGRPRPDSLRFIAVGGGHVSTGLLERAERVKLPVFEGYGLSECGSVVALNRPSARRPGRVGRPLPHARVRIARDGEILVLGPHMQGYLGHDPVPEHAPILTGDIGRIDDEGFLRIEGRKRNVFITSHGRNVSPEWVESELAQQPAISRAAVFGEARPWNVAVIVPSRPAPSERELEGALAAANSRLPDYARIRRWVIAREPFTPENGLVTANGRCRRDAIWAAYRDDLVSLYEGSAPATGVSSHVVL